MAGSDIKKYAAQTDEEFDSFQKRGMEIYRNAEQNKKPVIAAVNGFALGGGFEITLACDLIVAAKSASFGLPEVNIGLVPGGGGTQRLITKIGMNRVKEMLMFGGRYPADKMLEWGVVNYVVEDEELIPYAKELASKLCRRSASALAELKRLALLSTYPIDRDERLATEIGTLFKLFHTPEAKKLIDDFANKSNK
jgi:enoyl-CoA hydratase/carnithine racemase